MNIDEAIEILEDTRKKLNGDMEIAHTNYNKSKAIETIINDYNNLKQIEEEHRIENGELRTKINELEREINGLKQTFTIHDNIDNHIPHID
jgi:polyhydroxyalkanoate synthesis regulator phasin